ncbi:hypothetical protein CAEBREN_23071 [Caenorhabditis brenneri]|uniref:Chromo domain-containing protein n=1 Tax=Caenorhabditis brenneri TaxID=135651 RepID=G0NQU3_CAEBE|nr:hypothetical protein CAEBREN_23071 [Caenorhabditis brenneri]
MPRTAKKARIEPAGEEKDTFQVEKLTKKKVVNGKNEYFVKWLGYSAKENTWEPEDNLKVSCQQMLDELNRAASPIEETAPRRKNARNARAARDAVLPADKPVAAQVVFFTLQKTKATKKKR